VSIRLPPDLEEIPAVLPGLYDNITEQELDRDTLHLQLPEADSLFATEEELRAMRRVTSTDCRRN
jgi:hypothetical protein